MVDKGVSNEIEYEIVGRGSTPSKSFKDNYWVCVERALERAFHSDPSSAERLRKKVDKASADTQTAFYHADPFEVAADLAGRQQEPITPEEKRRYIDAVNISDSPEDKELRSTRPEEEP
jgi:hypothetical protein